MNTIQDFKKIWLMKPDFIKIYLVAGFALLLFQLLPSVIHGWDETAGNIDPSIWMLVLLGIISFLLISGFSWILLKWFWNGLGLPSISYMVTQFRTLELWQQLSFFWASFALLLSVGAMCLIAIC